jgi:hypothetical protein
MPNACYVQTLMQAKNERKESPMIAQPETQPCETSPEISARDRELENLLRCASTYQKVAGGLARTGRKKRISAA